MSLAPKERKITYPREISTYKIYINGEWLDSESGETFLGVNPATLEVLGNFQKANEADLKKAIDAAEEAFPIWSSYPAPRRGAILLKIAEILKREKEELAKTIVMEMGKPIVEARGDVQEAIDVAEYMAGEGRRLFGHTTTSELRDKFCMSIRRPIGICALITPWNFPIAIPAWKLMAALICGNTVIFKPSSDTPLCAIKLVEICEKAGIPEGVVNLITGSGGKVGEALVKHPKIRCVSFTGHRDTGRRILEIAGLKRVGLELGGKNAILVMPDADLSLALDGIIWGGYGTTGQRCTAASRVIVHESIKEKLEKAISERAKKLKIGYCLKEEVEMGPLVNEAAIKKVHSYTEIGLKEGAKLLTGGKEAKVDLPGFFYEPTLFTNATGDMRIAQEEIFGPTITILSAKNLNEMIEICNAIEYGLVASIYTKDISNAFKAIEKIESGITYVNASTIGAEIHLPFGGVKHSGIGTREGGIEGINEFTETKTVYIDYSGRLQKAQIEVAELKRKKK